MIYKLRKRHFYFWCLLGIILPLGFLLGVMAIPDDYPLEEKLSWEAPAGQSTLLSENDQLKVNQVQNGNSHGLHIIVKEALMVPSVLVYLASSESSDIEEHTLLGFLDSKRDYYYKLSQPLSGNGNRLILYDPLNKKVFKEMDL